MTTLEILTEVEAGRMSPGVALELLEPVKVAKLVFVELEIGKIYSLSGEKDRFRYIGTKGAHIVFKLLTGNYGKWAIGADGLVPFRNGLAHKFIAV